MKEYNKFEEFVKTLDFHVANRRRPKDRIAFMGFDGDENIHEWDSDVGKSNFRTNASVLCMYEEYRAIEWKCIYHNTNGFYIKFHGKNVYLDLSDNQEVKIIL